MYFEQKGNFFKTDLPNKVNITVSSSLKAVFVSIFTDDNIEKTKNVLLIFPLIKIKSNHRYSHTFFYAIS